MTDVDECKLNNGDCRDICVNAVGGYYCACSDPQFSIAPDKRHCVGKLLNFVLRTRSLSILARTT